MQAPYDTEATADVFAKAKNTFNWLVGHLTDAQTGTLPHNRLEETITEQGRELQRLLLQAHLDLRALREREQVRHARHPDGGAAGVIGADGVPRRRVELGHHRLLATVTGTVTVTRCAWRAPGVRNVYPADAVLSLPAVRQAAARARATFRTRLAAGEKPARKRMATLGVVYDAEPAPRRPHDVIAVPGGGRSGRRLPRARPNATRKWLCGSVITGPGPVIAKVFDHAEARDPAHARPWVVLVDGARHQLDLVTAEAVRRRIRVRIVIDFVHVLEKLWAAAWSLHPPAAPAAEDWVAGHALALLSGHTGQVITTLTAQAATAGAQHRDGIDACIRYLSNNAGHLRYDQALEAGWPIATGVIEGACRHLIADRFDLAGARWGLAGAEAVLKLRALVANGHLEECWTFHLARQHERIHQTGYQDGYALTA
ncbi:hypothetical protein GCM10027187_64400 [Streptosporangium sandarakinum]